MRSRHLARGLAVQTLYSLDINGRIFTVSCPYSEGFAGLTAEEQSSLETEVVLYSLFLINGVLEHISEVDRLISRFSTRRGIENISIVDRNILRISFFTLLYCKDIDTKVVLDEAVKLSQEYSTEINYKFINGLLDAAVRNINDLSEV